MSYERLSRDGGQIAFSLSPVLRGEGWGEGT
jgi:hypothetical protein